MGKSAALLAARDRNPTDARVALRRIRIIKVAVARLERSETTVRGHLYGLSAGRRELPYFPVPTALRGKVNPPAITRETGNASLDERACLLASIRANDVDARSVVGWRVE